MILFDKDPVCLNFIFKSPFFPDSLGFGDTLAIISIVLGVISIVLSFIIYKLSNSTSEQLAKDAAQYAFDKLQNVSDNTSKTNNLQNKDESYMKNEFSFIKQFDQEKINRINKSLLNIIKNGKKKSKTAPWVYAASFPVKLKEELDADETVILMLGWREKGYLKWSGKLENQTPVYITKGSLSIESLNSRES